MTIRTELFRLNGAVVRDPAIDAWMKKHSGELESGNRHQHRSATKAHRCGVLRHKDPRRTRLDQRRSVEGGWSNPRANSSDDVAKHPSRSTLNLTTMANETITNREIDFKTITPSILYFGNPVAIISSINPDGSPNLAPVSSFWELGWTIILGLLCD